jgi:hypothetical protein
MALAVCNRPEDRETLKDDAAWLANAEVHGAYFYDDRFAGGQGRKSDLPDQPPPRQSEKPPPPPRIVQDPPVSPTTPKPPLSTSGKGRPPIIVRRPAWPVRRIIFVSPPRPLPPPPKTPPPRNAPPMPRSNQPPAGTPIDPASLARPLPAEKDPKLRPEEIPWDNSNSQFGMLGVLAAAEAGIEIPEWYWKDIEYHWLRWQMPDGGWAYRAASPTSTLAMTCAGVSAMSATADWIGGGLSGGTSGREPFSRSLEAGLYWLAQGENAVAVGAAGSRFISYDLFSLARAGGACGFKYFGDHDWYRELAADVLTRQSTDGSWGGEGSAGQGAEDRIIETAYALLFLSRGQHPVLLTKLRFDGTWANHPYDAANLARYVGRALERGVNWQVVDLQRDWTDWLDSPILYLASQQPPKLNEADYDKLRIFTAAGGMLFTHADSGSAAFNQWVAELVRKLWPAYELRTLPDDHDIYTIHSKLAGRPHVKLMGVSNGSRLLLLHAPVDLAGAWQMRAEKSRPEHFQWGLNLFAYATGKSDLRNRLDVAYLPPPAEASKRVLKLARLKYPGNWDPEPMAWTRFSRWLQGHTGVAVESAEVEPAALKPGDAAMAHLTGTAAHSFSAPEAAALRAYVEAGGALLIDSCGGGDAFVQSVRTSVIGAAFADAKFVPIDSKAHYRTYVLAKDGAQSAKNPIEHAAVGKGHVYLSRADITSGLLGTRAWGIYGFEPEYAAELLSGLLPK